MFKEYHFFVRVGTLTINLVLFKKRLNCFTTLISRRLNNRSTAHIQTALDCKQF